MKRLLLLLVILVNTSLVRSNELTANLGWCAFSTPDSKSYVETYLSFIGNSLVYVKNANGKFQASIDVTMIFTMDDSIKAAKRYTLNSPETSDTSKVANFLDLQRIPLPMGFYTMQLVLADLNRKPQRPITNWKSVIVDIEKDSVSLSGLEFLDSYSATTSNNALSKSGYDLVPYVSTFLPSNMTDLNFYGEIYNTSKVMKPDEKFVVFYYIESSMNTRMNDYNAFVKLAPQKINSLLYSFKIGSLPSGSYHLVVEVRNSSNRLLCLRSVPFERFNPGVSYQLADVKGLDVSTTFAGKITNADTLSDYIRSLRPISSDAEAEFAENRIKAGDVTLMQQYLYNFWLARNETDPEAEWHKYNAEVQKVNHEFGTQIMKGYQTDRGRVYLQYGPPDQRVVVVNEPSSYPYEIWQYYHIDGSHNYTNVNQPGNTQQTNKKFVFADFDLATNNYMLIHSDARGEVRDDGWKTRLLKRDNAIHNIDNTDVNPQYGGNSSDWYTDPH
ncbi:MAG: GWxTD domain-containing protein [Bacteroidetes bacterium]|nr:GWxTD domain-containing protein [Bacteroidota bacterium]